MHRTYNIRESLGSGGCGDVFLGVHKRNGVLGFGLILSISRALPAALHAVCRTRFLGG